MGGDLLLLALVCILVCARNLATNLSKVRFIQYGMDGTLQGSYAAHNFPLDKNNIST